MIEIGLTGGIASGKSTVAAMFRDLGAHVIDADGLARKAVAKGSPVLAAIAETFGEKYLTPDGELDRAALRELIFNDPKAREKINDLVHPEVNRLTALAMRRIHETDPEGVAMLDVPLLFETKIQDRFLATVLVWAPPAVQIKRLMKRDRVGEKAARAALASQMPIDEKKSLANFVVDNSNGLDETLRHVEAVWGRLSALKASCPNPAGS